MGHGRLRFEQWDEHYAPRAGSDPRRHDAVRSGATDIHQRAVVGHHDVGETEPANVAPAPETAAWTMIANLVLNLDETITRN